MLRMGESTADESVNLYLRGVEEGRAGQMLDETEILEILDVFGVHGLRSYIVGHLEGVTEAMEYEEE